MMLQPFGIGLGGFGINPDTDQKITHNAMAISATPRQRTALISQEN